MEECKLMEQVKFTADEIGAADKIAKFHFQKTHNAVVHIEIKTDKFEKIREQWIDLCLLLTKILHKLEFSSN